MRMFRKLEGTSRQSFSAAHFDIPHSHVSRTLVVLAGSVAVLTGGAFLVQMRLTDRQIEGAERVRGSLDAEVRELDQHWRRGEVPAKTMQAENDHISDERAQQEAQLSELKKSADHG